MRCAKCLVVLWQRSELLIAPLWGCTKKSLGTCGMLKALARRWWLPERQIMQMTLEAAIIYSGLYYSNIANQSYRPGLWRENIKPWKGGNKVCPTTRGTRLLSLPLFIFVVLCFCGAIVLLLCSTRWTVGSYYRLYCWPTTAVASLPCRLYHYGCRHHL